MVQGWVERDLGVGQASSLKKFPSKLLPFHKILCLSPEGLKKGHSQLAGQISILLDPVLHFTLPTD